MPKLVHMYIRNVLIGWLVAAVFVAVLVGFNVANLGHLVLETRGGYLAGLMLWMANGVVFAGVQFAIAVMRMAEDDEGPRGGHRRRIRFDEPAMIRAEAPARRRPGQQPRRRG
ncbi:hypothetical protein [Acidimangrovimonas sediminis]|uniref:hypothetical protein n=1 Tax=Acidimangrovimonas sediminis TaxID=2056283 RepID=UPI000C80C242|nr:hypothetical protein [Acidimangrovimonas sediminis]